MKRLFISKHPSQRTRNNIPSIRIAPIRRRALINHNTLRHINIRTSFIQSFFAKFREMFESAREGQALTLRVRRGSQTLALATSLRLAPGGVEISADPGASPKAVRIRSGILRGTTDR